MIIHHCVTGAAGRVARRPENPISVDDRPRGARGPHESAVGRQTVAADRIIIAAHASGGDRPSDGKVGTAAVADTRTVRDGSRGPRRTPKK